MLKELNVSSDLRRTDKHVSVVTQNLAPTQMSHLPGKILSGMHEAYASPPVKYTTAITINHNTGLQADIKISSKSKKWTNGMTPTNDKNRNNPSNKTATQRSWQWASQGQGPVKSNIHQIHLFYTQQLFYL